MGKIQKTMYKVAIALLLIAAVSAETFNSNLNMYENPWVKDQDGNWHAACHRAELTEGFMQQAVRGRDVDNQGDYALCMGFNTVINKDGDCTIASMGQGIAVKALNYHNHHPIDTKYWCTESCDATGNGCPGNSTCVNALYDISGQGVYRVCAWKKPTA